MAAIEITIQFTPSEWSSFKQINADRKKLFEDFHSELNKKFQVSRNDVNCFLKCRYFICIDLSIVSP